jgi:methionyl-tRNA formyltransferase
LQKIKVIFMGTPSYATTILKALINHDSIEVVALFTQEDKPVGRKQILTPPDVKKYCLQNCIDIPIFQPKKLRDEENVKKIKELNPDFIVVAAFGQILPKSILDIAPCINLHASILPKYRGASPIQDAIKNGDALSGVTAMLMEEGLDTGDILGISYIGIKDMDAPTLFEKLSFLASDLTIDTLLNFQKIKPLKQNNLLSTHCKKIKKEDGVVSFDDAKKIYQKYLAYLWWPNIFLENGLKLKKIALQDSDSKNEAGKILGIESEYIIVGCKRGSLKIFSLQPPSKKEMKAVDYLRGKRLSVGDSLL